MKYQKGLKEPTLLPPEGVCGDKILRWTNTQEWVLLDPSSWESQCMDDVKEQEDYSYYEGLHCIGDNLLWWKKRQEMVSFPPWGKHSQGIDPMEEGDKDPYYEGGTCGEMRQERRVWFFGKEGILEIFSRLVEGRNELKYFE